MQLKIRLKLGWQNLVKPILFTVIHSSSNHFGCVSLLNKINYTKGINELCLKSRPGLCPGLLKTKANIYRFEL